MNMPIVPDNVIKMWNDPHFQLLAEVDKLLNSSKIWGGMDWSYNPIYPVKYLPVRDKVNQALADIRKEYGIE